MFESQWRKAADRGMLSADLRSACILHNGSIRTPERRFSQCCSKICRRCEVVQAGEGRFSESI